MLLLFRIRWTGVGCLGLVLWLPAVAVALALAGDGGSAPGVALALGFVGAAGPVWLLGSWLNSGSPVPRHTLGTTSTQSPMEYSAVPYLVFGLVFAASVVGRATSPVLGWVTFVGVLVGAIVVAVVYRERRRGRTHLAAVGDRAELAQRWGWRYEAKASSELPLRWKALVGWRVLSITPFGVVGGELDGVPFTAFDSETDLAGHTVEHPCTTVAVHLPHAYPRISTTVRLSPRITESPSMTGLQMEEILQVMAGEADPEDILPVLFPLTSDDVEATTDLPGFAEALLTPAVRQATLEHRLIGWRIEGRDLVLTSGRRAAPRSADEVLDTARHLVHVARLFPADLAARYGAEPVTDIPLPIGPG